ncbi:MAG: ECF transporter S component [Selenomonadaceae bacterium]|nr:ECF transporter S component [Selenomonadaceae bacterium]
MEKFLKSILTQYTFFSIIASISNREFEIRKILISGDFLRTKEINLIAIMSAFVFIATFIPKIPIPLGYAHLGDAAIFLTIFVCGRKIGILSGIIGSAFADLLSGFPLWILPTILIKAGMAEIFFKLHKKNIFVGLILASLFMTVGYTIFGAILYESLAAGISSTPGLLIKSAVNIFVAVIIISAIKNKNILNKF